MALIKSTILSAIRGSINGTTFAQNRFGAYARNRTVPVNPNTANQVESRAYFGGAAQQWNSLSKAEQIQWNTFAASIPHINRLGDTTHLTGFNWFCATTSFLSYISGAFTLAPAPTTPGLGTQIVNLGLTADVSTGVITVSSEELTAAIGGNGYALWYSDPQPIGVDFFKGPWNRALKGLDDTTLVASTFSPAQAYTVNTRIFYRARILDPAGKMSSDWISGPRVPVP